MTSNSRKAEIHSWTPIATRPRVIETRGGSLKWKSLKDAPVSIQDAYQMAAAGELLIANRHKDDVVELVVRSVPLRASHIEPVLTSAVIRK